MAKILAKLLPSSAGRVMKLRRLHDWTQTELDTLDVKYEEQKNKKLDKFTVKANKKLLPTAFKACDKNAYAENELCEKLKAYDVKARMSYRGASHKAFKAIFEAVKAGKDWADAVAEMKQANAALDAKRNAYIEKLNAEKAAFLAKNNTTDSAEYDALSKQVDGEYKAFEEAVEKETAEKCGKERARLQGKLEALSKKIEAEKVNINTQHTLPDDTVLSVRGLKMYFGGLKAVDDLTFDVKKGEIFGLIGPNGAGKTTVFNCITQFYKPTGGQLIFTTKDNETVSLTDYHVHDIVLLGIARTFQNVEVVKEVSVLDNLLIAATRHYTSSLFTQMLHLPLLGREEKAIRARADRILKYMDLSVYRDRLCWGLPYGILKKVEIARALMCSPKLIILDEPAAGLNESETSDLAELINNIRKDFDCTILLVEHDMSLVMNVCDHICAISFGKKLAYGTAKEVQASKEVQEAYLGVGGE